MQRRSLPPPVRSSVESPTKSTNTIAIQTDPFSSEDEYDFEDEGVDVPFLQQDEIGARRELFR